MLKVLYGTIYTKRFFYHEAPLFLSVNGDQMSSNKSKFRFCGDIVFGPHEETSL